MVRIVLAAILGGLLMFVWSAFAHMVLPFERAATYSFDCTAHASGQMTIVVAEAPATPWARIRWRWNRLRKKTQA